ncbi:hypothetical protein CLV97_104158 [Planifilum fimeticola]|jgi:hypothetical protein|uniref:Uncharacterized protein n=2 Tax=Planifilum TaxID=332100 RepID=A0A1I2NBE4_9BACL|nr:MULTISPECIES: hypothetical protein [Planifilum]MBO2496294.1 hypothetical protein [Bacillota bacterium]MBO2531690.1 hypothetical protein [Thermoactinomycetaceae bacterium]PRX41918.1 hypothetical protein CLV97_104158 [Planifilum fimeticola]SFG01235.1 hypothetical protein SAMN04488025_11235 [Planifilum fulgidum]
MNRRYWVGYAAVFSMIWIATGLFSVIEGGPQSQAVLVFSFAFALVLIAATWLSSRLLAHIRRFEAKRDALYRRGK